VLVEQPAACRREMAAGTRLVAAHLELRVSARGAAEPGERRGGDQHAEPRDGAPRRGVLERGVVAEGGQGWHGEARRHGVVSNPGAPSWIHCNISAMSLSGSGES